MLLDEAADPQSSPTSSSGSCVASCRRALPCTTPPSSWKCRPRPEAGEGASESDEVGWRTAIEASPWLLGSSEPDREVPPEEFFDKLKPFKELVSEDVKEGGEEPPGETERS